MATAATILKNVRTAVADRATERAQVAAAARVLAEYGYNDRPEIRQGSFERGSALRFYLFMGSPAGDFVLITGPSVEAEVKTLDELDAMKAPEGFYIEAVGAKAPLAKATQSAVRKAVAETPATKTAPPAPTPKPATKPRAARAAAKAPPKLVSLAFPKLNKNNTLREYLEQFAFGEVRDVPSAITETQKLSAAEYDQLVQSFLEDRPWLKGKGGTASTYETGGKDYLELTEEQRAKFRQGAYNLVIKVTAPGRPPIYVDPQGYDYARYVAFDRSDLPALQALVQPAWVSAVAPPTRSGWPGRQRAQGPQGSDVSYAPIVAPAPPPPAAPSDDEMMAAFARLADQVLAKLGR